MSHKHLSTFERELLARYLSDGLSHRRIALLLDRDHRTISREIRRNSFDKNGVNIYCADRANQKAVQRRRDAVSWPKRSVVELAAYVRTKLLLYWSPEQISGRLCLEYQGNSAMQISPESIYRWVYDDTSKGGNLFQKLRSMRKRRRRKFRLGSCLVG